MLINFLAEVNFMGSSHLCSSSNKALDNRPCSPLPQVSEGCESCRGTQGFHPPSTSCPSTGWTPAAPPSSCSVAASGCEVVPRVGRGSGCGTALNGAELLDAGKHQQGRKSWNQSWFRPLWSKIPGNELLMSQQQKLQTSPSDAGGQKMLRMDRTDDDLGASCRAHTVRTTQVDNSPGLGMISVWPRFLTQWVQSPTLKAKY